LLQKFHSPFLIKFIRIFYYIYQHILSIKEQNQLALIEFGKY